MSEISLPKVSPNIDGLSLQWESEHLQCDLTSIYQHHDGNVACEIHITTSAPGFNPHLLRHHINDLANATGRDRLANLLKRNFNHVQWDDVIEQVCEYTLRHLRRTPTEESMTDFTATKPPEWVLWPFLIRHENNMLFAPGGVGKSYMALFWSILMEAQVTDNTLKWIVRPEPVTVLYLDWERSRATHAYRFSQLLLGLELPTIGSPAPFNYHKFHQPLSRETRNIQSLINQVKANFLICDSAGMAAGGDINTTLPAIEYFEGLGALQAFDGSPLTTLTLAHTAKNTETGKRSAYGNAYWTNEPSSIWEIIPNENGILTLHNNKHNDYQKYDDIYLQVDFHGEDRGTMYSLCDAPVASHGEGHDKRVYDALSNIPQSNPQIAQAAGGMNIQIVNTILGRLKKQGLALSPERGFWERGKSWEDFSG